jgi:hypothetical protein
MSKASPKHKTWQSVPWGPSATPAEALPAEQAEMRPQSFLYEHQRTVLGKNTKLEEKGPMLRLCVTLMSLFELIRDSYTEL